MKRNLHLVFFTLLLLLAGHTYAQDAIQIAVLPFTTTNETSHANAEMVTNQVIGCFSGKTRFMVLDRTQTEKLKKELDAAKDKASVYSKMSAEQGHLAIAEYIITGTVSEFAITAVKEKPTSPEKYHGTAHIFLQINKVETGEVLVNKPFNLTTVDFPNRTEADIKDNLLCHIRGLVEVEVRNLFPPEIGIVKIVTEKKGLPETLLIDAGAEMFDSGKQAVPCPGDGEGSKSLANDAAASGSSTADKVSIATKAFGSVGGMFAKKIALEVMYTEILESKSGKKQKHEIVIAQLKIEKIEGQFTKCSVSSGAKEMKQYTDEKKDLWVRVKKD